MLFIDSYVFEHSLYWFVDEWGKPQKNFFFFFKFNGSAIKEKITFLPPKFQKPLSSRWEGRGGLNDTAIKKMSFFAASLRQFKFWSLISLLSYYFYTFLYNDWSLEYSIDLSINFLIWPFDKLIIWSLYIFINWSFDKLINWSSYVLNNWSYILINWCFYILHKYSIIYPINNLKPYNWMSDSSREPHWFT